VFRLKLVYNRAQSSVSEETEVSTVHFITSAKEVMFSLCLSVYLLVCLLAGLRKNYSADFHNGKAARGPRKTSSDFGGKPDHATLRLGLWLGRVTFLVRWSQDVGYPTTLAVCYLAISNSNCSRHQRPWRELCALLSAILLFGITQIWTELSTKTRFAAESSPKD